MKQIAPAYTVDLTTGVSSQSDPVVAFDDLAITLTGTQSLVNANMRAALFRLTRTGNDGVLVATCNTFSGLQDAFVGTMGLNTIELLNAFKDLSGLRQWETLRFQMFIYDASTNEYMIVGDMDVAYNLPLAVATPPHVSPITTSTTTWGDLKLSGGVIYFQNPTDSLWYPLRPMGAGTEVHIDTGTGIAL